MCYVDLSGFVVEESSVMAVSYQRLDDTLTLQETKEGDNECQVIIVTDDGELYMAPEVYENEAAAKEAVKQHMDKLNATVTDN